MDRKLSVNEVQAVVDEIKLALDEDGDSALDNLHVGNLTNWVNDSLGYEMASHKDNQVYVDERTEPIVSWNDAKPEEKDGRLVFLDYLEKTDTSQELQEYVAMRKRLIAYEAWLNGSNERQ